MKTLFSLLAASAAVIAVPAVAQTTINFDDGSNGASVGAFYSAQGVTFSNTQFVGNFGLDGASDTLGIRAPGTFQFGSDNAIVGTFSGARSSVSIRGLDVGSAGVRLDAFNSLGVLIGSDTFFGSDIGVGTFADLSVTIAGISSFRVYQPLSAGNTNAFGDGALFDNLGFSASAGVPEPATWALMILGFGAVGGAMRRRQSVKANVRFA